jgi:hypothetical protein
LQDNTREDNSSIELSVNGTTNYNKKNMGFLGSKSFLRFKDGPSLEISGML